MSLHTKAALLSLLLIVSGCSASGGGRSSAGEDTGLDTAEDTGLDTAEDTGEDTGEDTADTATDEVTTRVELTTSMGAIVIELHPDTAPKTVENFLGYVDSGHYAGTVFHRVIAGFMIQGGGFDAEYAQKSTEASIDNEADTSTKNTRGTLAMARTGDPHSATAQFFVNVADNAFLDHTAKTADGWGYTVFAEVVEGMDVVDAIAVLPTGPAGPFDKDAPQPQVIIEGAARL